MNQTWRVRHTRTRVRPRDDSSLVPMRSPVRSYLLGLHETVCGTDPYAATRLSRHRTVAAAEPEADAKVLYGADPTQMGIAMTMADGHTYQVGDADVE